MNAKKIIGLMLALAMSSAVFTGCGEKKEADKPAATAASEQTDAIKSKDDLAGKTIGVQLGTTGDMSASEYEEQGSTVERYSKGADAIMALNSGKIDCVVIDAEPAKAFVEKNADLKILDEPFAEEQYAVCVSKDKPELTKKINDALKKLEENGTLKKIEDNYIGDDTKGKTPYTSPEGVDRSNGKLIMATNAAFEPYEFYDNEKIVGIDADMMQAVCDELGMELQIDDMEFDSIITAVQSGKADVGAAGMTVTEDRLKNIDFTDPYTTAKQVIIVRK